MSRLIPATTIDADATSNGQGGTDRALGQFQTSPIPAILTARGGSLGGNGGYIETSGAITPDFQQLPRSPPHRTAKRGTWDMDPASITIILSGGDRNGYRQRQRH